jgi:hypothetical protein
MVLFDMGNHSRGDSKATDAQAHSHFGQTQPALHPSFVSMDSIS